MSRGLGPSGALLAAAVAAPLGCRPAGSEAFQGHWRGVRIEGVSADAVPAGIAFATATELTVKGDTLAITAPRERQSGKYRVLYESATRLVIAGTKDASPETFTFVDARTMKWAVLDGKAIVFVRE